MQLVSSFKSPREKVPNPFCNLCIGFLSNSASSTNYPASPVHVSLLLVTSPTWQDFTFQVVLFNPAAITSFKFQGATLKLAVNALSPSKAPKSGMIYLTALRLRRPLRSSSHNLRPTISSSIFLSSLSYLLNLYILPLLTTSYGLLHLQYFCNSVTMLYISLPSLHMFLSESCF